MSTSDMDPTRITRRIVPCGDQAIQIIAGWNGNVESYFFVATWIKDFDYSTWSGTPDNPIRAGDLYIDGGYPREIIPSIADLVAPLMEDLDWANPELPAILFDLLADREIDASSQLYADAPSRYKRLPDLIGRVLERGPVLAPRLSQAPTLRHGKTG
jgi:hypothetical protein